MSSKWVSEDRVSDGNKRILISTYISLVAHLEHICIFTDFTEAVCVCLGFLWLDVKIDKKPSLSSSYPTTKFPTVLRYFHCYEPWGEQQLYSWRVSSILLGRSWALPGTSGHFFFRAVPRSYEWAMMILWTRNTLKSAEIPIGKFHVTSRVSIHQGDNRLSDVSRGRQCPHWGKPIKRSTFWSTNKLSVAYEGD